MHVLLGEMVPEETRHGGPEKAAMSVIPAHWPYVRTVRPNLTFYSWCTGLSRWDVGVEPRERPRCAVSTRRAQRDDRESVWRACWSRVRHNRSYRALANRNRTVADVAVRRQIHAVAVAAPGYGQRSGGREGFGRNRLFAMPVATSTTDSWAICTSRTCVVDGRSARP